MNLAGRLRGGEYRIDRAEEAAGEQQAAVGAGHGWSLPWGARRGGGGTRHWTPFWPDAFPDDHAKFYLGGVGPGGGWERVSRRVAEALEGMEDRMLGMERRGGVKGR